MTTPRSSRASATAGVGSTPPRTAVPPAEAIPRARAASSSGPEPRVSRPTNTRRAPLHSVAARPSRSTSSGVRSSPTTPRTPSVPKYRRPMARERYSHPRASVRAGCRRPRKRRFDLYSAAMLRGRGVVIAVVVALALSGSALAAGTAASWKLHQLDADRCWDATSMDADYNGRIENIWYDVDNDCAWDTRIWNSVGGDSFLESMTLDMDEDGRWEYWL